MEIQNTKENLKELIAEIKDYVGMRMELGSMQFKKSMAVLVGNLSATLLVVVFAVLSFLFGSFALAYVLGEYFQSTAIGFSLVTLLYLLLAIIFLLLRKGIQKSIANNIIKILFSSDDHA
jgi:cell shape-determining protein MreD